MEYAIIRSGGKQYRVRPGDVIEVDKLNSEAGKNVALDVLMVVADGDVSIGNPLVSGAKISATVVGDTKGEKIRVSKFKSKVRYRRTTGFRASLTRVQIDTVEVGGKKLAAQKPAAKVVAPVEATVVAVKDAPKAKKTAAKKETVEAKPKKTAPKKTTKTKKEV